MTLGGSSGLEQDKNPIEVKQGTSLDLFLDYLEILAPYILLTLILILVCYFYKLNKRNKYDDKEIQTKENNREKRTMSKCKICGKETNDYKYCIECFQKIQQGETEECKLCGEQYIKGTICKCTKADQNVDYTQKTQNETPLNVNNNIYERNEKSSFSKGFGTITGAGCGCVTFIFLAFIAIVLIITNL